MSESFEVCVIQLAIRFGKVEENLERAVKLISKNNSDDCRLFVLPEMWTSGYDYRNLSKIAEKSNFVIEELCGIARACDAIIIGSMPEADNSSIYNTAFVIDEGGNVAGRYRKVHLFSPMAENKYLSAGKDSPVFQTSLGKIAVMLCFDIRFPEFARSLALGGAEILVVPAQWPTVRVEHWKTLLKARAIENQLFVIGAAASGRIGKFDFCGNSMIIAPDGTILAKAGKKEKIIKATINLAEIKKARTLMPCYQSRVPEVYKI
ncbi:MAG: carbon-nitrogen family hydrolase [Candidatus Schekmanbacteria bacterium]|nr:carbon-nitrogen family hydrolase [Candidatus Schekmanbacteria bacterium]